MLQHLNVPPPTAAVPVIKPGILKRPREQPPIHPDVENDPDWQHLWRERQNATRAKNTEEEIATWSRHKTNRHTSDDEQDTPWERWIKETEFKAAAFRRQGRLSDAPVQVRNVVVPIPGGSDQDDVEKGNAINPRSIGSDAKRVRTLVRKMRDRKRLSQ